MTPMFDWLWRKTDGIPSWNAFWVLLIYVIVFNVLFRLFTANYPPVYRDTKNSWFQTYAEDEWKMGPAVTLNVGVRYDLQPGMMFYPGLGAIAACVAAGPGRRVTALGGVVGMEVVISLVGIFSGLVVVYGLLRFLTDRRQLRS